MRLKSATFRNLKPIYRSSGKKEIFIDFTKCKHKIILILGPNGSGKTTIMNALQPLPESPSLYLDGEDGEKIIEYFFEELIYRIRISYPSTNTGNRGQTKAFLTKIMPDGNEIELNPNGNIGSYKDILYAEFKLDPNFISLTQLSMEDRGIVERIPSDRKKYINSMLEEVQVYNDIHKALVKRSSIFRSMVNSITAKIDSVGDKTILEHQLESLNQNIDSLNDTIELCNSLISSNEATLRMIDPNGEIQERFARLTSTKKRIDDQIKEMEVILVDFRKKYQSTDMVLEAKRQLEEKIIMLNNELEIIKSKLNDQLVSREEDYRSFQIKQQKLNAMQSEFVVEDMKEKIEKLRENQIMYKKIFDRIGIDALSITRDEYIIGLNTLKDLKTMVMSMRSFANQSDIETTVYYYRTDVDIQKIKYDIDNKIQETKNSISECEQKLSYFKGLLQTTEILEKRPKDCNTDTCPFIYNAIEAYKQNPKDNINIYTDLIRTHTDTLKDLEKELEHTMDILQLYQFLTNIIRSIKNHSSILHKLPNGNIFGDIDNFLESLINGSNFDEINELYAYIQYADTFELYRSEKEELTKLEYEYKLYENKIDIIEEIANDLSELHKKLNYITDIIRENQDKIGVINKEIIDTEKQLNTFIKLKEMYEKLDSLIKERELVELDIANITLDMKHIEENLITINQNKQVLYKAKTDLAPLQEDRDKVKFSLARLDEYYKELEVYSAKYNTIELIKKYSSPTKGGIQTIFMKLYMSKTMELTNQLLSYFFNGELELLPYVINETEFRIPCKNINSSVINDDISSCSGAEKSIISMILSFALLNQSSTKYNILKTDEMDATLDQDNKAAEIQVYDMIMDMLGVENWLMVSHSSEIDLSNVDIILLSNENKYGYDENVIYSF